MLSSLRIQNIVLIDKLNLVGAAGLCALTGETGAGKSILLDALGLALGARADAGLVRHGTDQAMVTASFDVPPDHTAMALLNEKSIPCEGEVILRRTLNKDGRSKAFINDEPVSVQFLKEMGLQLVEIHGQFATQGLLDPATHRKTLDDFAGTNLKKIREHWQDFQIAREKLDTARREAESLRQQEDFLRYAVNELNDLDPKPGEEDILANKRARLKNRDKMKKSFETSGQLIDSDDGILNQLGQVENALLGLGDDGTVAIDALKRARAEVEEVSYQIEKLRSGSDLAGENLSTIENRYFKIREMAKKHRCTSEDLPRLHQEMIDKLNLITNHDDIIAELEKAVTKKRAAYIETAEKVSIQRKKAAIALAKKVEKELPDLKLDKAKFFVDCTIAEENVWGPEGFDRVQFMAATNPQTPPSPLHKSASGGELARFMLAIKAVLAADGQVTTLIFDEVDSGIGGATAHAVGARLARLAETYQVLVVTHSPQVAARADHHWYIAKSDKSGAAVTDITPLNAADAREEEIARMLSGAKITKEARAQAAQLLKDQDAAA